ncbi:DUF5915 domain-containing protein, partial [Acinetobacter baumannii]
EKMQDLITAEVNVKEIEYLAENSGVIRKKAKANFKTLGSKLGTAMKEAAVQIATFSQSEISALEQDGKLNLEIGANSY